MASPCGFLEAARPARPGRASGSGCSRYGSGTGHLSRRLARPSAFDLSEYARTRTASCRPRPRYSMTRIRVPDGAFDLVLSLHVLEHIPDPAETLRDFARWLRPGAACLLWSPTNTASATESRRTAGSAYRDDSHCSLLSSQEWVHAPGRRVRPGAGRPTASGIRPYGPAGAAESAVLAPPTAAQVGLGRAFLPAG